MATSKQIRLLRTARSQSAVGIVLMLAVALAVAVGSGAEAQSIVAPTDPVPAYKLVRLAVTDADSVAWCVIPPEADIAPSADGTQCVLTAPPGRYTILAAAVRDARPVILAAPITIAGEPAPAPSPEPTPPPAPEGALEVAAARYGRAVPVALREAAARVRDGRVTTVSAAQDIVRAAVATARAEYGQAIDTATRGMIEADGRITDPQGYARVLTRAATALEGAARR